MALSPPRDDGAAVPSAPGLEGVMELPAPGPEVEDKSPPPRLGAPSFVAAGAEVAAPVVGAPEIALAVSGLPREEAKLPSFGGS